MKVLVGDDDAAVAAAREALRAFADPNRPVVVALAAPVYVDLTLVLEVHRDHQPETVRSAVSAALLDPLLLPFGSGVVRIGSVVYDSEIYDACLDVPGVVAVHDLAFRVPDASHLARRPKAPPGFKAKHASKPKGAGAALRLDRGERHAPGAERLLPAGLRRPSRHRRGQSPWPLTAIDTRRGTRRSSRRSSGDLPCGGLRQLRRSRPASRAGRRVGAQAAVVRRSIDRLWEDQSIESCEDWVVDYIGDLLATN